MAAAVLDEDAWKAWDKNGKTEFLKHIRSRAPSSSSASAMETGDVDVLWSETQAGKETQRLFYDLLWKCIRGIVKRDQAAQALGEAAVSHPEVASLIVDTFIVLDAETAAFADVRKEDRSRLLGLLRDAERYLPEGTIKERMDIEPMGDAGILKYPKKFFSTCIKLKTKLFYKQQKFNLFREECEGYAKLITELNQDLSLVSPSSIIEVVKSIIGYFNLDPNRVLDIVLESFECQLDQCDFFIELLRLFTPDSNTLNELLGFKFKVASGEIPETLYHQTALMIQHGILDFESVYALVGTDDQEIFAAAETELAEAKEFVRKVNIVSTNKDKDKSDDSETSSSATSASAGKKFALLEALLRVGAWAEAESMLNRLPSYYAVSQPSVAQALQELIHITIDPLHKKCSGKAIAVRCAEHAPLKNSGAPKPTQTFEEFQKVAMPMLLTLGPYCHSDSILMYKVLRILKTCLGINDNDGGKDREKIPDPVSASAGCLYYDALTLMDEVFLPSLSLTDSNCCLAEEIWSLLRYFPYHYRYRLYGQWKSDTYGLHPQLLKRKATMQKNIKRIMQRISKENVKPTSRQLAKLTHSSAGLLFDYILSQIQLYDNLIGPVVDSFRYLSSLSFDILGYSIIEALNNPEKDQTKHDGTSISLWLQSLSTFCGAVFKKYSIELTGVLQYVANQLKSKRSLDLLILKEIVHKMGGIESAEEMTAEQIDAMAGGELLRAEAGSFNQVKNTKKSSQRLKDALIDNHLAVPLCLLMAQQRNCVVYQETESSHLKLVGKLFDQCQDTLVQFGTFLASNLSIDDYMHRLPPMKELLTLYHVNSDLAFFLARPMFNHQISLKCDELRKSSDDRKNKSEEDKQGVYVKATLQVMLPVIEAIRPLHPSKTWDDISPQFLTTFWSLTMFDLFVPDNVYSKELARLKTAPAKVDENKELNSTRKKKEKERLVSLFDKMVDEQRRQKEHVESVMARLKEEKDAWFFSRSAKLAKNETITSFLQLCLFPRCVFTITDAIYCAKFVHIIHMLKTPNFSTLICFDRIFCDITYTVTSCTENEAQRYGRFLSAMLEIVMNWHSSKEVFERECVGYPGFVTKFRVAQVDKSGGSAGDDHVDYENYRHVCHKWHYKIAKALVVCLESKDYVQIRNALIILTKILPFFPIIANLANVIEKRIEKVCADEKEKRKDLFIVATSYMGQLKARKPQLIKENEFHMAKKGSANGEQSKDEGKAEKSGEKESSKRSKSKEKSSAALAAAAAASSSLGSSSSSSAKAERKSKDRESKERSSRDSKSKERSSSSRESKERRGADDSRKSRERHSQEAMGPPQSASQHRKSTEPTDSERDAKRRKTESSSKSSKK